MEIMESLCKITLKNQNGKVSSWKNFYSLFLNNLFFELLRFSMLSIIDEEKN